MKEITVSSSRLPTRTGSQVPGYPGLTVGKRLGGSPYTLDRIYDLVKEDGTSSGLVIKVCDHYHLTCSGKQPVAATDHTSEAQIQKTRTTWVSNQQSAAPEANLQTQLLSSYKCISIDLSLGKLAACQPHASYD